MDKDGLTESGGCLVVLAIFAIAIILGIAIAHSNYNAFSSGNAQTIRTQPTVHHIDTPTPQDALPSVQPMAWQGDFSFTASRPWKLRIYQHCRQDYFIGPTYLNINKQNITINTYTFDVTYTEPAGTYAISIYNLCPNTMAVFTYDK